MVNSFLVTLLVGLLHIVLTDGLSQQGCGMGGSALRAKIFGGKQSSPGMWPWQVGIHKQNPSDDSRYGILCGGALIDPQWVVTAAHCFYVERRTRSNRIWFEADITSLKKYKIIAGDINTQIIEPSQQERYATEVYIHPGFRHSDFENDIALVKLNQAVTTNRFVRTVCLPGTNIDFAKPGTIGIVAGWGGTRKSSISTLLLHTSILIKTNAVCKQTTIHHVNETVTFCAGDDKGRNDACHGDSGGSLVRRVMVKGQKRWVTVGLVSWGEGCGLAGKYGYYTRMLPFVAWIKDTVNSSRFSCSLPGDIPFGKLINDNRMTRFLIDDRVEYRCVDGYILRGESGRKCKGGGKWTRPPVCVKERHCPFVRAPRNGMTRPSKRRYSYKEKIRFYCDINSVMTGRSTLTCEIDGRWDGYPPLCLVPTCLKPNVPDNAFVSGKSKEIYKYNEEVIYTCDYGYVNVGDGYQRCLDGGKWTAANVKCIPKSCGDPGTPKNGKRRGYVFTFKKKVYYECDTGYERSGPAFRQCQSNQRWSDNTPTCECVDRQRINPKPSRSCSKQCKTSKDCGKKQKCLCDGDCGFSCIDNGVCNNLDAPQNGEMLDLKFDYDATVRFRCKNGYSLRGKQSLKCINGTWSHKVPLCKANCRNPGIPSNGQRNGSSFNHLDVIKFSCNEKFIMVGASIIQCFDGRWTNSTPKCKECGSALGMESGKISDRDIRASSRWNWRYDADNGRLNHRSSAWCSSFGDKRPYLEIDLGNLYKITYVATQGLKGDHGNRRYWVSKYIVSYSLLARSSFIEYRETSKEKVFSANKDAASIVKHKLKKPFITRKIRFIPIWYNFRRACMRVEVYGCDCVMVGSRVLGRWGGSPNGGSVYYKASVRSISRNSVQLEIEDKTHHDNYFKSVAKTDLVLDVPNKQFNLPRGTRVLMGNRARYYTATIVRHDQYYYVVNPDDSRLPKRILKKDIRVLKQQKFCASN